MSLPLSLRHDVHSSLLASIDDYVYWKITYATGRHVCLDILTALRVRLNAQLEYFGSGL